MSRPCVVVMVKAPRAGEVKTRLVPPLSGTQAASLAACFARDVVAAALRAARDVIVAYAPADGRAALEALTGPDARLGWLEQGGGDLGARLSSVVARAASSGFGPVVVLGSDSPTLPDAFLAEALAALARGDADVTLGPTADGGYYLVGVRRPAPGLFENVAWSTPRAFRQTADNAARLGLRLRRLPPWYDVDTAEDLARLRREVLRGREARLRAPTTHRWLLAHARLFARAPRAGP